jgi:hypothetical protein
MFSDPISVTINSVAKSLPRQSTSGTSSTYGSADGVWKLLISHATQKNGRIRSMIRLDQLAVVSNPLDSTNDYDTLSVYTVIDRPAFGFTTAQVEQIAAGLFALLSAGNIDKIVGMES